MWPQQMASTVYINHGTKSILIPWMEEILHHLIRGFSWFIPLFIGFQHVSTIPGAGFFHPAWRCQATSVLSSTGSIDSCARGESRGSVGPSAGSACGIRVHLPAVSRGFCGGSRGLALFLHKGYSQGKSDYFWSWRENQYMFFSEWYVYNIL